LTDTDKQNSTGKYTKLDTAQKKQATQNTAKQNYPGLDASYDTRPGNDYSVLFLRQHESTIICGKSTDQNLK